MDEVFKALADPTRRALLDALFERDGQTLTDLQERFAMKDSLVQFFTWWNGQTFGTQLWTWRFGELVGQDEFGNRYYRTKGGKIDPTLGFERRWVIYNGYAEASRVPPSWHGCHRCHGTTASPTATTPHDRSCRHHHAGRHDKAGGRSPRHAHAPHPSPCGNAG